MLCCPLKLPDYFALQRYIHDIQPQPNDIDALQNFPFLHQNTILSNLKRKLPTYLAKAADVSDEVDPIEWWWRASQDLPSWSGAA